MTTTKTIQELATEARGYFTRTQRTNGEWFFSFDHETTPEWVHDLAHAAHGDMLPDDYRYEMIVDALSFIADNGDTDDGSHEFADSEVSASTADRTAWLASHLDRVGYMIEAQSAFGAEPDPATAIGYGWYLEAHEVYESVLSSLADRSSEDDD